jgi:hypothetical protein
MRVTGLARVPPGVAALAIGFINSLAHCVSLSSGCSSVVRAIRSDDGLRFGRKFAMVSIM